MTPKTKIGSSTSASKHATRFLRNQFYAQHGTEHVLFVTSVFFQNVKWKICATEVDNPLTRESCRYSSRTPDEMRRRVKRKSLRPRLRVLKLILFVSHAFFCKRFSPYHHRVSYSSRVPGIVSPLSRATVVITSFIFEYSPPQTSWVRVYGVNKYE